MATLSDRTPENVPGRYYVDSSCIACDQCRVIAPELFAANTDTGLSYIQRQPLTDADIALVEEALAECAVDSIGNNGS